MGPALMIQTGAAEGIQGHFTALGHEPHNYTIFYVQVEDINEHLEKAAELGGKVVVPKVEHSGLRKLRVAGRPSGQRGGAVDSGEVGGQMIAIEGDCALYMPQPPLGDRTKVIHAYGATV